MEAPVSEVSCPRTHPPIPQVRVWKKQIIRIEEFSLLKKYFCYKRMVVVICRGNMGGEQVVRVIRIICKSGKTGLIRIVAVERVSQKAYSTLLIQQNDFILIAKCFNVY